MGDDTSAVDPQDSNIGTRHEEKPLRYEIYVEAGLDHNWSQWFAGMDLERVADERTRLVGPVEDQAALHGVLAQIRDLGLEIISIVRLDHDHKETS